jgi:hypothetical protein
MKRRTRSQNTSHCDFLTELEFFYNRYLEAAAYDVGGASQYLRLAAEIADIMCSHFGGCRICGGRRAKWHGAPSRATKKGPENPWDEVRRWIGVPTFERDLEPRLGHCWVARLIASKGKFIYPLYTGDVAEMYLKRHLYHCENCDPAILRNLIAATPAPSQLCPMGKEILAAGEYPFTGGYAYEEHAKLCDVCSTSDEAHG